MKNGAIRIIAPSTHQRPPNWRLNHSYRAAFPIQLISNIIYAQVHKFAVVKLFICTISKFNSDIVQIIIERILSLELNKLLSEYPIVTILGPRQSGKTTLAKHYLADFEYRNLELPDIRAFAEQDPIGFLADAGEPLIIDEIQRVPNLLTFNWSKWIT